MTRSYHDYLAEILIPEDRLQMRVRELGAEISRDYAGQEVLLICILRGGVMFLTDLMRSLTIPHAIDFMAVSSYGAGARESRREVRIAYDLKTTIEGRSVLLVEDIVDTGHTLAAVMEILETREPHSLRVCTLLDKAEKREVVVPLHYVGFQIPDKFVFGYGLDLDEYFRELPFIAVAKVQSSIIGLQPSVDGLPMDH